MEPARSGTPSPLATRPGSRAAQVLWLLGVAALFLATARLPGPPLPASLARLRALLSALF